MEENTQTVVHKLEHAETKNVLAITTSFVNGHISFNQMFNIAKTFAMVNNLTGDIYRYIVKITDAQLDGQIGPQEYRRMYKQATKTLTDKDKRFLRVSHSVLYGNERTKIKQ